MQVNKGKSKLPRKVPASPPAAGQLPGQDHQSLVLQWILKIQHPSPRRHQDAPYVEIQNACVCKQNMKRINCNVSSM
jgi:hypothetical protein